MARTVSTSALLLNGMIRPDDDPLHVRVYRGAWAGWDFLGQVPNQLAADPAAIGALSFQFRNGRWGLYGAPEITMGNFTGPSGDFFYAVTYRPSDGFILTARNISGPVNRGPRVENYVRLQVPSGLYLSVADNGAAGYNFGNTRWGERLFLAGYLNWPALPWAAALVDAAWNPSLETNVLAQIPAQHILAFGELPNRQVLNDGQAVCGNIAFSVPAGRNMGHVAIFLNTGDPATAHVVRLITFNLSGKGVSLGTVPVWLDFAGHPALWFGYG